MQASARVVLQDFNQGNISYYVEAPAEYKPERQLDAAVVTEVGVELGCGCLCADILVVCSGVKRLISKR